MNRRVIRFASIFAIAVGAQFAAPAEARADEIPTCASNAASMCNPPTHFETCSARCDPNSTGYVLTCNYSVNCPQPQ